MTDTLALAISAYKFMLHHEDDCESPRDWDNLGTLCLKHGRYNLPWEFQLVSQDRPTIRRYDPSARDWYEEDCLGWSEIAQGIRQALQSDGDDFAVIAPVYMLDHSGLAFSLPRVQGYLVDPFGWLYMGLDSGLAGFIFITRKQAEKEYGWKQLTAERKAKLWDLLKAEVETYDRWSRGECYWYEVRDQSGETVDTCGGYIGHQWAVEAVKDAFPGAEEVEDWDEEMEIL